MSDRDTLLQFIETHYDGERLTRLASAVAIDATTLRGQDTREKASALLLAVEREGMAGALLSCLEREFPGEVPALEWAGAHIGLRAARPQSAPAPSIQAAVSTKPPASTPKEAPVTERPPSMVTAVTELLASLPEEIPDPDEIPNAFAPDAGSVRVAEPPAQEAPPEQDLSRFQAPLMDLRDGVEELEVARRNMAQPAPVEAEPEPEESAPEPAQNRDGMLGTALKPEEALQGRELPFRFVHGYTLPAHWAPRDKEIAELVAEVRENRHQVVSLIAIGGTGKSALTRKLLDELPRHNVRVDGALWFSFYVEPEFDRFLTEACRYLIPDFDPVAHPSPYEKGVLLREAMEQGHYLIVLDGIEVLLVSDRSRKDFGSIIDRALREFLEGICESSRSQVMISARWPLTDLTGNPGHKMLELADLSPEAAGELLASYGVQGAETEQKRICTRFGSHALTLQVLSDYLTRYHQGNPQGIDVIAEVGPTATQGIKLQSVLDSYWQRLQPDERFFLTRMSAFRGGVDERSFLVLSKTGDVFNPDFRAMVTRIIKSPLVSVERREGQPRLTAHPLIKTFFYERMGDDERDQTHRALKDYAQGLPLPDRPHTLADYEPLLEACHHCLQVGLYTEAYHIYRRNNMDNALRWWGHYAQAHALLEPLRDASRGTVPAWKTERWQKSWVENETALLAMLRGDAEMAMERFRNSANMDSESSDGPGESASWQNLASVQIQRGDFWGALESLGKSQTIEAMIGRYEKEDLLAGLEGICHAELGQVQVALELLSKALGISIQRPNWRAVCYWTWRLGDLYLRVLRKESSYQNYEEALAMAQREQFKDYEGHALRGLGDCCRVQKDFNKSRAYYTDALRLARTLGNPYVENEVRLGLARLAEAEQIRHDADVQARQVVDRAEECGYLVQATEAHVILARCAREADPKDMEALVLHVTKAKTLLETTAHFWTRQELDRIIAKEPTLRE